VPMDSEAWCALANTSHPEAVVRVHADYIAAGARIITTNTFASAPHVLRSAGIDDAAAVNIAGVELARRAVEEAGIDGVLIAGSISSMAPLSEWRSPPVGAEVAAGYREQAELLADAGVDVLVAEMMMDLDNAALAIDACRATGLPVLVGWSASPGGDGTVSTFRSAQIRNPAQRSFAGLIQAGVRLGGDAHGIMHSSIEITGPALAVLADHWDGPTMAYAETGRFEPPNWVFPNEGSPASYAATARRWVDQGVQIVGGCCGTTPEHIAAISAALGEQPPGA
jgi:methionine synthase I (cobalamin-dependent)